MKRGVIVSLLASVAAIVGAVVLFACAQTPTSVPVRTFERAQRMDVVCLQVYDPITGRPSIPKPLRQEECAPVPPSVNGGGLLNQLFALVTQSTRGEIAVVDLSAGGLIDQKRAIPGINFLPVGKLPTDVAVTPDGQLAFVGASEPNRAAIYGIPTRRILGDTTSGRPADPDGPVTLASWPVCALPQNPGALTVVPRRKDAAADAGASDAPDYELVAVLPGDPRSSAKIVTIDPRPFLRGAKIAVAGDAPGARVLEPGAPVECPITAAIELAGDDAVPATLRRGKAWGDGIPYVDGGVNLTCDRPMSGGCKLPSCCGPAAPAPPDAGARDSGSADAGAGDASASGGGACADPDPGEPPLDLGPLDGPRLVAAARDDQLLYVADLNLPLVHVIDLSIPGAPKELAPFVATSLANPARAVSIGDVAVSPTTRDYKRYLYAVDRDEGSIIVYDVTDPRAATREPLRRPHAELNPFQPDDRISFASPVVAVSFARHDYPLRQINGVPIPNAKTGVLCNPNPNEDDPSLGELGQFYRAGSSDPDIGLDPRRLRGIFAFATLATGQVVAIDVDDWDAPCRRPALLGPEALASGRNDIRAPPSSSLALPQPSATGPDDTDPYHVPLAPPNAVSDEVFFPVSMPHRMRSDSLLRVDSRTGNHVPRVDAPPSITANGVPLAVVGPGSENSPLILPTSVELPKQSAVSALGVRFSTEVPDVHIDQDWALTYEGAIPGFEGVSALLKTEKELAGGTPDDYGALVLWQTEGRFCARGVEDWTQGGERANAIATELASRGGAAPARLDRQMVDYVQIADELLGPDDPYWSLEQDPAGCWQGVPAGRRRHEACSATYGSATDPTSERDFPIVEAYQDRLVVSRFYTPADGAREVVAKDASNAAHLRLMRCCFHHQVRFRVRTAGEWALVGKGPGGSAGVGFLSHMAPDAGGRCVASCDPREALLNARAPAIPGNAAIAAPDRNSALALRNPMFAFWMLNGIKNAKAPLRDAVYTFRTRGQFTPLTINIGANTFSVTPQSTRFIETLGQIAVVDAASQGLVLIDLGGVSIARAPYF